MPEWYELPLKLVQNRVYRSFAGGRELDRFRGIEPSLDDECPEAWVGSTTWNRMNPLHQTQPGANADEKYGIALVELGSGRQMHMDDLVKSNPAAFLGKRHADMFGSNTGILVKLLDARDQLLLGAHPTREVARAHFSSDFGKVESWYMLDTRKDGREKPYILLGFKEGITREWFAELYDRQDIPAMDACCHKFEVSPGEMYFIAAGLPHAVGDGCFLLEVQEPTDLNVSVRRWWKPEDPRAEFLEKRTMDCIDFTGRSREETLKKFRIEPKLLSNTPEGTESLLLGKDQTTFFSLSRLDITGVYRDVKRDSFSIAIVISGEGDMMTEAGIVKLKKGDELFLPAGIQETAWKAGPNGMSVLKAFPEGVL